MGHAKHMVGSLHRRQRALCCPRRDGLALVKAYQVRMEWLIKKTAWPRHFCQELKESIRGPLWRYDPEVAEREDDAR